MTEPGPLEKRDCAVRACVEGECHCPWRDRRGCSAALSGYPGRPRRLAAYFAAAHGAALEAQAVAGAIAVPLEVAGARIDLVFAGTRLLVEFMPALRHLEADPVVVPEVTFHVWDGQTTGVRIPLLEPDGVAADELVEPDHGRRSRFRAEIHAVDGPSSAIDLCRGQAIYWVKSAERLVPSNLDLPMHALFRWALERSHGGTLQVSAIRAVLGRRDEAVSVAARGSTARRPSTGPR